MTRKEAAQRIATLLQANNIYPEMEEAVHIAIEALEQEEPFMNKPCIANQVCHEDKVKTLEKIRAEIDRQQKWLMHAGYAPYNVDIVLDAIKRVIAESEAKI